MNTEDHIKMLHGKIREGKVALFLGAGAGREAGLPDGRAMADLLRQEFQKSECSSGDLIELLTAILETPGYDRTAVERFIKSKLQSNCPSESHKSIPRCRWRAIFTTNWDDLIELTYRLDTQKVQNFNPVVSFDITTNTSDRDMVNVYKLMGCVSRSYPNEGAMVLTRSDYIRMIQERRNMMRTLRDAALQGPVLYIGSVLSG